MWDEVAQTLHESTVRVLSRIAGLLPGTLAMALAVILAALLAWGATAILGRLLRGMQFDEWLERRGLTDLADWSPARSPSLLTVRVVGWSILALGFALGLAAFDATLTSQLAFHVFAYVPRLLVAGLVVLAGVVIGRFLGRKVLIESVNMNLQYARLLSLGVKWMVMVLTVAMALDHLGIGSGIVNLAFGILFGGIVLALALAVGLGSKEMVSRSLERESARAAEPESREPFRHLY
jgi:hypothetical protein